MPLQTGDLLLNKYRIEALIGQGAFAEVYHATHLALNAPRALKILRRDAPGVGSTEYADFHARFQLEAQLGAKLDHPNIIQVYDFEQDRKTLILVMEYAEGGNLASRIQRAREKDQLIPLEEAIQIGVDVAQGLSALHAMDAVHRDLKPSNILFDKKGHAKVADLGLAQVPGGPSLRSRLSQPLPHPGTPGYMSPEQEHTGNLLRPASDVYALGIVLFEMLTGRNYNYLKPGTRASELRQGLPDWLDDLLARMLADDPKDRPWDGAEVADLLHEGIAREEAKRKEEAVRLEAEENARRDEQARLQRAAEKKERREAEERAKLEAETKARCDAEEKARREAEQQARHATEQSARPRSEKPSLIAGGILAGVVFLSIVCLAAYALIILPRQKSATAAQQTTIEAQNAQVTQAMTQTADTSWMPTYTPNPSLPLIVSPTPIIDVPSNPADFISTYFGTINNGDYQSAWSMLTQNFKDTHNKSGYQPYADWWQSIQEVEVLSITINSQSAGYADLSIELSYYYTNGNVDTYDLMEFTLLWDSSREQWLIDDGRLVKGTR